MIERPLSPTPELEDRQTPTEAVIDSVATATQCSPLELEPIVRTIDPDALDRLVESMAPYPSSGPNEITFRYSEFVVTVSGDGTVELAEPDDRLAGCSGSGSGSADPSERTRDRRMAGETESR